MTEHFNSEAELRKVRKEIVQILKLQVDGEGGTIEVLDSGIGGYKVVESLSTPSPVARRPGYGINRTHLGKAMDAVMKCAAEEAKSNKLFLDELERLDKELKKRED